LRRAKLTLRQAQGEDLWLLLILSLSKDESARTQKKREGSKPSLLRHPPLPPANATRDVDYCAVE
jgi:hypothetical protein